MTDLRLLFLTSEPHPTFRADVAALFSKHLPAEGIFSDIVTTTDPRQDGPTHWGGGEALLCVSGSGAIQKHLYKFFHSARHVLRADRTRYQAVLVRDMPFLAAFCALVALARRMPFYYWMSYPVPEGQICRSRARGLFAGMGRNLLLWLRGKIGQLLLYRLVLRIANHTFVQSDQMKCDIVSRGIDADCLTPVPMGVDLDEVDNASVAPCEDVRLTGRVVLLYLGTLERPRQIELLFEMLSLVRQSVPNAILVLVGDTRDEQHRDWLRAKAHDSGVAEFVVWTGWLPMRDGWRYVKSAQVGLSPFPRGLLLDSASPTKVPEYLAFGIPVVCNDNPDQQFAIESSGAGICVPYTPKAFADAAITLIEETKEARGERATSGRNYVQRTRSYRVIARNLALKLQHLSLRNHEAGTDE